MFEARTDISIESLKPSMRDINSVQEAPVGEGVVAAVKADGECAFRRHEATAVAPCLWWGAVSELEKMTRGGRSVT